MSIADTDYKSYISAGLSLAVLYGVRGGACTCQRGANCPPKSAGKHPIGNSWTENNHSTLAEAESAIKARGTVNWGVHTGARLKDGRYLFVWDVDTNDGKLGAESMQGREIPETFEVKSGSGGIHYYFSSEEPIPNSAGILPGIDIRGEGGQAVAAGSENLRGKYEAVAGSLENIAHAPEWMMELIREHAEKQTPRKPGAGAVDETKRLRTLSGNHEAIVSAAVAQVSNDRSKDTSRIVNICANNGLTLAETREVIERRDDLSERLLHRSDDDVLACWLKATERLANEDRFVRRTWDTFGNADRMVDHTAGSLLWVADARSWAVYYDKLWNLDSLELAGNAYRNMVERLPSTEARLYSSTPPPGSTVSQQEKFMEFVKGLRNAGNMKSTLTLTSAKPDIHANRGDFDAEEYLLGVNNGVLDLRVGELLEYSPHMLISKRVDINYNPKARCPQFMKYLKRVQPKKEFREFLQAWSGYCLTGSVDAQKFVLHYGPPAGGKSVYMVAMSAILGEYHAVANADVLHTTRSEQHPTGIATMAGKRFIQANESSEGRKLNEAVVNALTSSEPVSARFMRQNEFIFKPTGKINYITNHKPSVTATSGVWRRMVLMEWNVVIPESERDIGLADRLVREEAEGILAWAVEGALKWHRDGLPVPHEWEMAKSDFQDSEDKLGQFFSDYFELDEEGTVLSKDIYSSYQEWCGINGVKAVSSPRLGRLWAEMVKASALPIEPARVGHKQNRGWKGMRVREIDRGAARTDSSRTDSSGTDWRFEENRGMWDEEDENE